MRKEAGLGELCRIALVFFALLSAGAFGSLRIAGKDEMGAMSIAASTSP